MSEKNQKDTTAKTHDFIKELLEVTAPVLPERVNPHPMIDCPYYQHGGKCLSGCWQEPVCVTDKPLHGWKRRTPDGRFAQKETEVG